MANKGIAALTEFLSGVLEKITDPDQKRKAEETIATLTAMQPVAQALGDGVAGQAEIDRQLQTLKSQQEELNTLKISLDDRDTRLGAWHTELTGWYSENKTALEAAKGKSNGNPTPDKKVEVPPGVLTEEQYNERTGGLQAAFLGFSRDQNLITREHYMKFGEIVDLEPLLKHPQIATIGLVGVYELIHKERLDKWKTDADKAAEEKIRLDERQKVQASMAQMPYPSVTGVGSGSPLDALQPANKPDSVVDAATAHYTRLQAERAAGGTAR